MTSHLSPAYHKSALLKYNMLRPAAADSPALRPYMNVYCMSRRTMTRLLVTFGVSSSSQDIMQSSHILTIIGSGNREIIGYVDSECDLHSHPSSFRNRTSLRLSVVSDSKLIISCFTAALVALFKVLTRHHAILHLQRSNHKERVRCHCGPGMEGSIQSLRSLVFGLFPRIWTHSERSRTCDRKIERPSVAITPIRAIKSLDLCRRSIDRRSGRRN